MTRGRKESAPPRANPPAVNAQSARSWPSRAPTDGELDGWLSLPSFEPTEGEHLEEIATFASPPVRALAGVVLAVQAWRGNPGLAWPLRALRILAFALVVAAVVAVAVLR